MRFPWQKRKVEQPTDFPLKLNTDNLNWCRDARLLLIEGNGTLKWESRGRNEDWSQQYALTLRGTPLIVHNAPECPTCAGLLATGYGLDKADAPELQQISDVINAPYVDLDTSIASMAPLLGLLSSDLYVIAEGDSFPADGNGNFFWDVPDAFSNVEATGPAWYNDPDFEFTYSEGAPVFLYPSQPRTRLNQERVDYYTQRFDTTDTFPRAIAFSCAEGISVLLDGHHKACAAARLGRQLPCITIFPFGGYFYAQARSSSTPVPDRAYFGPFTVSISQLPAKILPAKPWQQTIDTRPAPYSGNLIRDSKLPQEFVDAGRNYPTWYEFGITTVADIGKVTDDDLSLWLENPLKYSPQLRAALIYLRCHCDPQLKEVAMKCADSSDRWSKLREAAFNHLAALKGDPEVEQYHERMEQAALRILKDTHDAEDAVQNAFLKIIRNFEKFLELPCKKRPFWCVCIVKNEAITLLRKKKKAIMLESMEDAYDASADIEKALSYEDIIRLFAGLPETYRAVLEMKFLLDCSGKDISQKLGISENAVNVRISRGRAMLREIMEKEALHL